MITKAGCDANETRSHLIRRLQRKILSQQIMKTTFSILGASLILSCASVCQANVIFSQDFSSSSIVSDYVNATPNSGQWNAISTSGAGTTVSIAGGSMQYTHNGVNAGSFTRNTDFSPTPPAMIYNFDLTVSGISTLSAVPTAATWGVGSGYGTQNSDPSPSSLNNSRFAIGFNTDGTYNFHVVGGATSSSFSSGTTVGVTWVINDAGGSLSYLGPDGNVDIVGNGMWDLWAGSTLIFNEKPADNTSSSLSELKFVFENTAATGIIAMDNFSIQAVPEPAGWGAISALGLMGICGLREWRQRRCGEKLKSCPVK